MSYEQAYQDGRDAFEHAHKPVSANPFSAWSALFEAWALGWLDARDAAR